jgi:hypothetical protein
MKRLSTYWCIDTFLWEVLKECINCSFSAANYSQCFTWKTNRDRFSSEYSSTKFLRRHLNSDCSRFHSFRDVFSTRNHTRCVNELDFCRIFSTMQSFKNEIMNVDFLFKTFFIQFLNAGSSLFATFLSRNWLDIFSISRDDDLKDFFCCKAFFTIATMFISFERFSQFSLTRKLNFYSCFENNYFSTSR